MAKAGIWYGTRCNLPEIHDQGSFHFYQQVDHKAKLQYVTESLRENWTCALAVAEGMEKSGGQPPKSSWKYSLRPERKPVTPVKMALARVLSFTKAESLPSPFNLCIHSRWCPELHGGRLAFHHTNRWQGWAGIPGKNYKLH